MRRRGRGWGGGGGEEEEEQEGEGTDKKSCRYNDHTPSQHLLLHNNKVMHKCKVAVLTERQKAPFPLTVQHKASNCFAVHSHSP